MTGLRRLRTGARAIQGGPPLPYGIEDAIQNMRILDALIASERTQGWMNLSGT